MAERLSNREQRNRARTQANAQNVRQDNITRRGNQVLAPMNPNNTPDRDNYQTYPYDYFSGADAKIFFGDVWVDDIVTIQYNVNQTKTPIWGYASQLFDAVARGQVIVQGTLSVSFKETGYLNVIQALLERQWNNVSGAGGKNDRIGRAIEKYQLEASHGAAKFVPGLSTQLTQDGSQGVTYSATGTPQFIRQSQTIEDILKSEIVSADIGNSLGIGNKTRDFEDFAELLEDTIWGDSNGKPYESKLKEKLRRADEFDYNARGGIKVGREPYTNVLNILMTFGDINDFRAEHTIVSINDVHFQSQGMIVSPDGTPIAETYNFFARDINNAISETKTYSINPIKLEVGVDNVEVSKLDSIAAIEDQLVKDKIPQFISIVGVAALPRGGLWKPLEGADKFTIIMDQREIQGQVDKEYTDANDRVKRLDSRAPSEKTRVSTKWRNEALVKRQAAVGAGLANRQFTFNGREPLVDQIIKYVEREFNEFDGNTLDVRNSQYIVDVEFRTSHNGPIESKLTMVLDQVIPESRTYKVIAPTRQNYGAASIITREDIFKDVMPAGEFNEELLGMEEDLQKKQQAALEARAEYESELVRVSDDEAEDIRRDVAKRAERIKKLQEKSETGVFGNVDAHILERLQNEQTEDLANIAELTNDSYNDADVALLGRKDRAVFEANRQEYDILTDQADYYAAEGDRVGDVIYEIEHEYDNALEGVTAPTQDHSKFLDFLADNDLADGSPPELQLELIDQSTPLQDASDAQQLALANENALDITNRQNDLLEFDPGEVETLEFNATNLAAALEANNIKIATNLDVPPVLEGVQQEIAPAFLAAGAAFNAAGVDAVITSVTEGTHITDIHSRGLAVDFRINHLPGYVPGDPATAVTSSSDIANTLQQELGSDYTVVIEANHLHVEYDPANPNLTNLAVIHPSLGLGYASPNPADAITISEADRTYVDIPDIADPPTPVEIGVPPGEPLTAPPGTPLISNLPPGTVPMAPADPIPPPPEPQEPAVPVTQLDITLDNPSAGDTFIPETTNVALINVTNNNIVSQASYIQDNPRSLEQTDPYVVLTPELQDLYPNAPSVIHIDFVDAIEVDPANFNTDDPSFALGSTSRTINQSNLFGEGRITIVRGSDPDQIANAIAHELLHQDQFGRPYLPSNTFTGPYSDQPGEIAADSAATENWPIVLEELNDIIENVTSDYDPNLDPARNPG